ncbi:MAG: PilZ domain-containing protein [gamma proteobacterium symbiont of Bathyaustriella thionipta]|nr:PilZ domain-containing protein [gamma proteobacterium symbiont of Bathyaustriella thionipta]MCU7949921.1 PilZ domain-containing protein [gamma proteobacterium symbiont of Bathyaustriella thionipta]MCU7954185.1 PilZ domain-containing protein [gamma proteobacterium symbiont of Bathyaustriella thionipta]MCU7956473.1 PilZ domain-containing protein [gamma proteobacterium symbiont of Bathyaustriella thionipta]MCU7967465.1 PilZ domain-containing protein [gamma proteobacterium symbiont of Bathyaustr
MYSSHEHRQNNRISVNFPVSIELANQKRAKGTAVNIGQGGMMLSNVSGASLSKLDDVNIHLPLNHNQNSFVIAAKVTRVNGSQIGLFFYSDPSEYLQESFN